MKCILFISYCILNHIIFNIVKFDYCLLEKKIKIAIIYKKDYIFLTGNHFDNTTYQFFMHALKRSQKLDITFFPSDSEFDTKKLKNKFDVIILPNNHSFGTPDLIGIEKLNIPVICRVGDPHDAKRTGKFRFHEKFKIDYYFNFMDPSYFYKFYPKNFSYKTIIFGFEPSLYSNLKPFNSRISNKIILSGALGINTVRSKTINKIFNPKRSSWYFYKLRTLCNELSNIEHARNISKKYENNELPFLLSQYKAAIAATTHYPTIKYMETAGSGCLTFMEITKHNHGSYLGYVDGETAIFINEDNYKNKFHEFLHDPENPKWEKIASAGQKFTFEKLSNDVAVENLTDLITNLIK